MSAQFQKTNHCVTSSFGFIFINHAKQEQENLSGFVIGCSDESDRDEVVMNWSNLRAPRTAECHRVTKDI
jgi:hypothetical protein